MLDDLNIQQILDIKAAWFEADKPDIQVMGILDWNYLELFRNTDFKSTAERFSSAVSRQIPLLYGVGSKTITLVDVVQTRSISNLTSFEVATYIYSDVILGIHYKKTDKIKSLSFEFRFIWGPFNSSKKEETPFLPYYKINKTVDMDNDIKLEIGQTLGTSSSILEQTTSHAEIFTIISKDETSLEKITEYMRSINHFLRLCIGETIYPEAIHGSILPKGTFQYYPYWLLEYYKRNLKNKNPQYVAHNAVIHYNDLKNNFEQIIQKWTQLWFATSQVMYDYFNIFDSYMSINTQFTECTNIIQRFYDHIHSQRADFRDEIIWFLDLCPNNVKENIIKNDFINKILNTRNYNVHGDDVNHDYVIKDGYELICLVNDLKSLIEIFLVSQLPIMVNKEQIMEKIFNEYNYSRNHPIQSD